MSENTHFKTLGMMSGTSLDGIDVAALTTDGRAQIMTHAAQTYPYRREAREVLKAALAVAANMSRAQWLDRANWRAEIVYAAEVITQEHLIAARDFIDMTGFVPQLVGFHGQTMVHSPPGSRHGAGEHYTIQLGDGDVLAQGLGCDVVGLFRDADMASGGQGAPLVPLYHYALARNLSQCAVPLAVLNLGGVANLTYLGRLCFAGEFVDVPTDILAFDTGAGNALLDDWIIEHGTKDKANMVFYDVDGALAARGEVFARGLEQLLAHDFFAQKPPKSLDRFAFHAASRAALEGCSLVDGLATLTAFTAQSVARAVEHLDEPPREWLVTGGGRHNLSLMDALKSCLTTPVRARTTQVRARTTQVRACEAVGWQGDALEAQAFGWLAVRSVKGLALSLPSTTGVREAACGGVLFKADD